MSEALAQGQAEPTVETSIYRFDGFVVDAGSMELRDAEGRRVEIAPLAFELLVYLIHHRSRVVSKAELFSALWGNVAVSENSLAQGVWAARRAVQDTGGAQRVIKNVRGRGYRFVADLETQPQRRSSPLVESGRAGGARRLVGRAGELQRLRSALSECASGRGGIVYLCGDAGIGKTRLADELLAEARQKGALVCEGRCLDDEGLPPLWPWQQAARELIGQLPPERVPAYVGDAAGDLVKLIPELRECMPELQPAPARLPEEERYQLFESLTALFRSAAKTAPVVVALDDLHWADTASLLMLEFIAAIPGRCRLLLIGTYRDTEAPEALARAVSTTLRATSTQRIDLGGLSAAQCASLLEAHHALEPAADVLERVVDLSSGNPFFVSQLARFLAHHPGASTVELPREVRDLLRQRIERLPARCQETLQVAAALGRDFRLGDLRRAAQLSADDALELLDLAAEARVIEEDPRQVGLYRFTHPLVRETIYQGIARSRRAALHRTIADAIALAHADDPTSRLGELARHYYEAAAGGAAAEAVTYLRLAGQRAMEATAYESARDHYRRALQAIELTDPVDERLRCDLMLGMATAMRGVDPADTSPRALFADTAERAKSLGDQELLAEAALCYAGRGPLRMRLFRQAGTLDAAEIHFLEEALCALGDEESGRRALVMAWLAWCLYNSQARERRKDLALEAIALARRVGDPAVLAEVLMLRVHSVHGPSQLDTRIAVLSEIIEIARGSGIKALQLDAQATRGWARFERCDCDGAEADIADAVRLAEELQQPAEKLMAVAWDRMRLFGQGRFEELDAVHHEELKQREGLPPRDNQGLAIRQFMMMNMRGQSATVIPGLEGYAQRYPLPVAWHCGLVSTYASAGQHDDARRELEKLSAGEFAAIPDDHNWIYSHMMLGYACHKLREPTHAAVLYRKLAPFAERMAVVGIGGPCGGVVVGTLAQLSHVLGEHARAMHQFEKARDENLRMGAPLWAAYAELDWAELLLEVGDADDRRRALAMIEHAHAWATQHDIGRLTRHGEALRAKAATL